MLQVYIPVKEIPETFGKYISNNFSPVGSDLLTL